MQVGSETKSSVSKEHVYINLFMKQHSPPNTGSAALRRKATKGRYD